MLDYVPAISTHATATTTGDLSWAGAATPGKGAAREPASACRGHEAEHPTENDTRTRAVCASVPFDNPRLGTCRNPWHNRRPVLRDVAPERGASLTTETPASTAAAPSLRRRLSGSARAIVVAAALSDVSATTGGRFRIEAAPSRLARKASSAPSPAKRTSGRRTPRAPSPCTLIATLSAEFRGMRRYPSQVFGQQTRSRRYSARKATIGSTRVTRRAGR